MKKLKELFKITYVGMILLTATGCGMQTQQGMEPAQDGAVLENENLSDTSVNEGNLALEVDNADTSNDTSNIFTVTFLDVGQGNSILIENDGAYMLVDGGDRDYASYVVSYLKQEGVETLDYVISSHYDADHLNGIVGVLNAFSCETLLDADYTTDTRVYESLLSVIEEKNLVEVHPDMGDVYTFGDATFTIVCPDAYDYEDDNDNSIGIRLEYGDTSFLICGDASERVEKVMIQSGLTIQSDVYLASHHGSTYSSSREFLEAVSPQAVVISAGAGNSYGHPAERVLSDIKEIGADLYRTDLQGVIQVVSDGINLTWNVEPCLDYRAGSEIDENTSNEDNANTTEADYVLNRNTMKFHNPACASVEKISEENRADFHGTREELVEGGYAPCGNCKP